MNIRTADDAEALMDELLSWAKDCQPREGLGALAAWRNRIEVCRAEIVAAQQAAGATDKQLDRLMGLSRTTRADRKRAKDRAGTISRNGDLANEVNSGSMTIEHLDAVAAADAKTGGEAANNKALLADIAASDADSARRAADQWLAERATDADLEKRRREQRRRREARKGTTADGLASLTIAGDDESVSQMWAAITETADQLYRADGGRELPTGTHPRTNAQRLFDAAQQYLLEPGLSRSSGGGAATILVTADRLDYLAGKAKAAAGRGSDSAVNPLGSKGDPGRHVRDASEVACERVDCCSGDRAGANPVPPAEMIGVGPIPDSLLEQLACNAEFVGVLFSGPGEVLWEGRGRRRPTKAQMLALVARDKGCVLCGAVPDRCDAHHLMPWSAPGKGETNIDELALVCQRHHREIHEQNMTLYRDRSDGRWRLRPATAHETPRPSPVRPQARGAAVAPPR